MTWKLIGYILHLDLSFNSYLSYKNVPNKKFTTAYFTNYINTTNIIYLREITQKL